MHSRPKLPAASLVYNLHMHVAVDAHTSNSVNNVNSCREIAAIRIKDIWRVTINGPSRPRPSLETEIYLLAKSEDCHKVQAAMVLYQLVK